MSIPLEETQNLLEQLAWVLDDSEPVSIEQVGPADVTVSEEDKAEMEAMLLKHVQQWTEKYQSIHNRLYYRGAKSTGLSKLFNVFSGTEIGSIPTVEELVKFVSNVKTASEQDYGPNVNKESAFSKLLLNVRKLSTALYIALKLFELDLKILESPLDDISNRVKRFYHLKAQQAGYQSYFIKLDAKISHPLNLTIWRKGVVNIECDINNLQSLAQEITQIQKTLDAISSESDLPPLSDIHALATKVDEKFGEISPYHAKLRLAISELESTWYGILDAKQNEAKSTFQPLVDQFQKWNDDMESIFTDFNQLGDKAFPWKKFPPSKKLVEALKWKIESAKLQFLNWPCVEAHIPKEKFELINYDQVIDTMKSITKTKILDALKEPLFPVKKLQYYIKSYQNLLQNIEDLQSTQLVDALKLQFFKHAHQQHRNIQWFQFFRRSYFDNLPNYDWKDIAYNAFSYNYGYSGNRTREVLQQLGWLEGENITSTAPTSLREKYNELMATADPLHLKHDIVL